MPLAVHLVSDLDGTWLPAPGEEQSLRALETFLASRRETVLTFATGRRLDNAVGALHGVVEMYPHHFITDVGTAIHHRSGDGRWLEDTDYDQWVASRWERLAVESSLLASLPDGVSWQVHVTPPRRRLALHAASGEAAGAAARALVEMLGRQRLRADVLASSDGCIDVLPQGVDKGSAVAHLARRRDVPRMLVVFGDAENDVGMLRLADVPVVMAGGRLRPDAPGLPADRVIETAVPGPAGILEVLRRLEVNGVSPA